MKKKKTWLLILMIIAIFLIGLGLWAFLFQNTGEEAKLKEEIGKLSEIDFTKETVPMDIVTTGDYALVEAGIKSYLNEYGMLLRGLMEKIDDERLTNILQIENYQTDGPNFQSSLVYLSELKQEVTEEIEHLVEMMSDAYIDQMIAEEKLSERYQKLYRELLLGDLEEDSFLESTATLNESKQEFLDLIDRDEKVLTFLRENQDSWSIAQDAIEFSTQELVDLYNALIES